MEQRHAPRWLLSVHPTVPPRPIGCPRMGWHSTARQACPTGLRLARTPKAALRAAGDTDITSVAFRDQPAALRVPTRQEMRER